MSELNKKDLNYIQEELDKIDITLDLGNELDGLKLLNELIKK